MTDSKGRDNNNLIYIVEIHTYMMGIKFSLRVTPCNIILRCLSCSGNNDDDDDDNAYKMAAYSIPEVHKFLKEHVCTYHPLQHQKIILHGLLSSFKLTDLSANSFGGLC